jgi:hypothetical protein
LFRSATVSGLLQFLFSQTAAGSCFVVIPSCGDDDRTRYDDLVKKKWWISRNKQKQRKILVAKQQSNKANIFLLAS